MKTIKYVICFAGIVTLLSTGSALAQSPVLTTPASQTEETYGPGIETDQTETIRIQAVVKAVESDKILVESQSEEIYSGEILLNTSIFDTRFVNGETGYQAEPAVIQTGDILYADIRTEMTKSIPPQTTAEIIICGMPKGSSAPDYILTDSFTWQEDESWILTDSTGTVYQIPKDCPVMSYSRNELSSFRIISKSVKLLVWLDEENNVQRIVKLPDRW